MESLTFKLEEFEGPLDLLLYLVGKNKMDLHEIAILDLIDQYTAVINTLTDHRLDVASEFIEMAARLVQMKSYLLLPRSEEAERLKQELTGQLIEYSACKEIAARMGTMAAATFTAVRKPMEVELDNTYQLRHDASLLQQAWFGLMGRSRRKAAPSAERFEPLVTAPFVSVASRVVHVLRGWSPARCASCAACSRPRAAAARRWPPFWPCWNWCAPGASPSPTTRPLPCGGAKPPTGRNDGWN